MSVTITSVAITDEWNNTPATSYLRGNRGEVMKAVIACDVFWAAESVSMTFETTGDTITRLDSGSFIDDGFKVGDTVIIAGTVSNNGSTTITSLTDRIMGVAANLVNEATVTCNIYGETPIISSDFYWNLVENNSAENFESLTDLKQVQKYNAPVMNAAMVAIGDSKGYQNESCAVGAVTLSAHHQTFTITHYFRITPIFLADELTDLQAGRQPNYLYGGKALKYIYRVDAKFDNVNPVVPHTSRYVTDFPMGNTGGYDEHFNEGVADYIITSNPPLVPLPISYKDVITTLAVDELQTNRTTEVTMTFKSNGAALNAAQEVILNVAYLPLDTTDYIFTPTKVLKDNFKWDRKFMTAGAGAVNGDEFGTDNQIITSATATVAGGFLTLVFTANLSTAYENLLASKDPSNRNYIIWVSFQDFAATTLADLDNVAVIADVNSYSLDQDDSSLFQLLSDVNFYEFPDDTLNPRTDYKGMIYDDVFSKTQFKIDTSLAVLQNVSIKINAEKTGEDDVILFEQKLDTTVFVPDCSTPPIQFIDIDNTRGFKYPDGDSRNLFTLQRLPASDAGNFRAYELLFGFKLRWEEWISNPNATDCFPNGNMNWALYDAASGWSIKLHVLAEMKNLSDGYVTQFDRSTNLSIADSNVASATPVTFTIKTFDITDTYDLNGAILRDADIHVVATFTMASTAIPPGKTGFYGFIRLDNTDIGGQSYIWEINNLVVNEDGNLLSSLATPDTGLATLTVVNGTTVTVAARLDYTKIDISRINNYQWSARLGYTY